MPLHRLKDYYPNYRETLADGHMDKITRYSVYTQGDDKVGSTKDLLVDDSGSFRYLVVDTGPWIFGKNVLLPIGLARFDYDNGRVYVDGLTKSQVEDMPEYNDDIVVDDRYEDRVRTIYQPIAQGRSNRQFLGNNYVPSSSPTPVGAAAGDLRRMPPLGSPTQGSERAEEGDLRRMGPLDGSDRTPSIYDRETGYYGLSEEDNHGRLRTYQDTLTAQIARG
jgi:stress response protein YsnF